MLSMNIDEIIKRVTIQEKNNEEKNESFSVSDLEEKYNNLYSNFEVKERKNDFLESMNKKKYNKTLSIDNLENIYRFLNYKNYQIKNNTGYSLGTNNTNIKKYNPPKLKKGRNRKIFNLSTSRSMNSLHKNNKTNKSSYELNMDKNKVYNRLYNRGFYVQNKICINKIKSEESFSKLSSSFKKINKYSQKLLLNKRNYNYNNKYSKNKSQNYYLEDETFKPKIDKNSIKIVKRLKKSNNKKDNKVNKNLEISFNNEKNNINKRKYDIFKNNYKNLYNYFDKRKYSYFNENNNKTQSQRILNLHKKNIENYKKKNNNEIDKDNNENNVIKNYENFKADNLYEKNKKWEKIRDEKIKNLKEIRQNIELFENMKDLDLPGKQNYEKYKNLIIRVFSPKEKPKSYVILQKKNYMNNPTNNEKEKNDINVNKNYLDSYNKNNRTCKHHRQKLKYVNNEGKEIFLNEINDDNDKNNNNNIEIKNKKKVFDEFINLVQENKENIIINDIIKMKNSNKNNKMKQNKNSLEYKIKNINKAFKSLKKK